MYFSFYDTLNYIFVFFCAISFGGLSNCFKDTFDIFLIVFVVYSYNVKYYFDIFYIIIFLTHYHTIILSLYCISKFYLL